MIDQRARQEMAQIFRRLATGAISSYEYEDKLDEIDCSELDLYREFSADACSLSELDIKYQGEDALSKEQRKHFARIILFLRSDIPFRWPFQPWLSWSGEIVNWHHYLPTPALFFLAIKRMIFLAPVLMIFDVPTAISLMTALTLAVIISALEALIMLLNAATIYARSKKIRRFIAQNQADPTVWPFFNRQEYQNALTKPVYLAGTR
jgi:hypothetical protein